jgi:hypothetical protein
MYHRPATVIGGDARLMMPTSHNNENQNNSFASKAANATTTTTPSHTYQRPRRAFGDISNKKGAQSGGEKGGSSSLVLKPRTSNIEPSKKTSAVTPRSTGIQQFPSRIPKLAESKTSQKSDLSKRVHPWSTQAKRSSPLLASSTTNRGSVVIPTSSRQVDFILPTSTRTKAPFESHQPSAEFKSNFDANVKASSSIVATTELVEDVELPAGRLWVDQDIDKDDEASTSSLTDLLDSRTMWDDYKESMKNEWEEERKKLAKEDEAILQSRIHEILQADDHGRFHLVVSWTSFHNRHMHPPCLNRLNPLFHFHQGSTFYSTSTISL